MEWFDQNSEIGNENMSLKKWKKIQRKKSAEYHKVKKDKLQKSKWVEHIKRTLINRNVKVQEDFFDQKK